jgi:hypothetical protein|tara:strand:+ start:4461 stop:5000 length:540 start_codon:yes stop_codon:yes gene_type:complete
MESPQDQSLQYTATWPTTIGSVCIVVGGLSLFGGCLALSGMSEMEQLHTAIPFGDGELSEELIGQLRATEPLVWITNISSLMNIAFSILLTAAGMALLQRARKARITLLYWSIFYVLFTLAAVWLNWEPRMELVNQNKEVEGMFLAQIAISMPLYLALPIFLLIFLNRKQTRNEVASWR